MPPHSRQVRGPALPCSCPWDQVTQALHHQGQLYCAARIGAGLAVVKGRDSSLTLRTIGPALLPARGDKGQGWEEGISPLLMPLRGTQMAGPDLPCSCPQASLSALPPPGSALLCCQVQGLHSEVLQPVMGRDSSPAHMSLGTDLLPQVARNKGEGGHVSLTHATTWQMRGRTSPCSHPWLTFNSHN